MKRLIILILLIFTLSIISCKKDEVKKELDNEWPITELTKFKLVDLTLNEKGTLNKWVYTYDNTLHIYIYGDYSVYKDLLNQLYSNGYNKFLDNNKYISYGKVGDGSTYINDYGYKYDGYYNIASNLFSVKLSYIESGNVIYIDLNNVNK